VARLLTPQTLGAWLLKVDPRTSDVGAMVRGDFASVTTRCVRPTYRTELVEAGQPVLLWVSGRDPAHPAGLHAQGWTTGPAHQLGPDHVLPVSLRTLEDHVPRGELLAHPVLASLEVLTMPAGSNPSYVTKEQLDALRAGWPQVTVAPRPAG
jgi:hypothetical protein